MILKHLVQRKIAYYLERYVSNFDKHALQLSVWGGEVVLLNLDIRTSALDELDLPISVEKGRIEKLKITIPWTRFGSAPIEVSVEGLDLVVHPRAADAWDEKKEAARDMRQKDRVLAEYEATRVTPEERKSAPVAAADATHHLSYLDELTRWALSNLRVTVTSVHVRYHDSTARQNFYWSLKWSGMKSVACDHEWQEHLYTFRDGDISRRREVTLEGLSIHAGELRPDGELAESDAVTTKPCSTRVRVTSRGADAVLTPLLPRLLVEAELDAMLLRLGRHQYDSLCRTARYCSEIATLDRFRKFRPQVGDLRGGSRARAWWQFASKCLLSSIHERRQSKNIAWVLERRRGVKSRYTELFKMCHSGKQRRWVPELIGSKREELRGLEGSLHVEDIVYFRRLAYAEMHEEEVLNSPRADSPRDLRQGSGDAKNGWVEWATGYRPWWLGYSGLQTPTSEAGAEGDDLDEEPDLTSPEQRRKCNEELGLEQDDVEGSELVTPLLSSPLSPRATAHWVRAEVRVSAGRMCVEMHQKPPASVQDLC
eukprot:Hpha_TRINITY_DN26679_c0_g1::TRINITY_DN26679_c0_g1_i1::g.86048::m.86048/K19525/VPS13A_C; vacuolar protein sorting-associated protein 13A/C